MNTVERVKNICKEKQIPVSKLEKDLGYANGYIGQLKKGTLPDDRLRAIADYLHVTSEYLSTGIDKAESFEDYSASSSESVEEESGTAYELSRNKCLYLLFGIARDAEKDELELACDLLKALKNKRQGK